MLRILIEHTTDKDSFSKEFLSEGSYVDELELIDEVISYLEGVHKYTKKLGEEEAKVLEE